LQIGDFDISIIETGYVSLDGGAMFGVVPKTLWTRSNPADELNRIILAMRLLLIKYKERIIITDAGVGNKMNEKLSKIYNVDYSKYNLLSELKKAGIAPQAVTDVLLTHLHFDHVGGATWYDPDGFSQLTFPNAQHHIQKKHWQWALSPSEKDGASFMKENYMAIEQNNRLNLLDGPGEFLPGMELLVFNGHTPAMQVPKISDGQKTFFYCADVFPTASHIPLPYIMGYDIQPMTTLKEKKDLLPKAFEEQWTLLFEHDPYHIGGTLELTEKGYRLGKKIDSL
jgi:glyoxylase-like metal-dependent hydrolase (beta-lactamase superfamily II)